MDLLILFLEFFKTGLFAVGGGLATLPFLYKLAEKYAWFTQQMIGDMIAISESTPGSMGINMATYAGYMNHQVLGAVIATVGEVTPSIIVIILVSKVLKKFQESPYVGKVFSALRPTVVGMIAAVGYGVIRDAVFHTEAAALPAFIGWRELILFLAIFLMTNKLKWHPITFIGIAAVVGVVFQF